MDGDTEPPAPGASWERLDRFAELRSHWVTLIGEHLRDAQGRVLEYWRVERASSVVVLPLHRGALLLPPPSFRPGVGRATLDFPGGRLADGMRPEAQAASVIERELGIASADMVALERLSPEAGWDVDSSFSSQRLHGFLARLHETATPQAPGIERVNADAAGIETLLQRLTCLQCRAVLQAWPGARG